MSRKEFADAFQRLIDEFDPADKTGQRRHNIYGVERVAAIYRAFSWMDQGQLHRLIDKAFESERYAPLAKDLRRIWADLREQDDSATRKSFRIAHGDRDRYDSDGPKPTPQQISEILEPFLKTKRSIPQTQEK